ncbi:MAG TPA: aconitase family protein, partial [candidate division Zixibacteria bacterium]|nr:aconitase family protein [candidate division Zixibacteria bacterium]
MARRRKIPTKGELLQLQKLYKTDEKIGERLGGVPAYLVAYWRRKKNVAKHSVPKFSEAEVRNLWERFGDDDRCGLELGISKAAFYNWRRRYGIREKPPFLKLEQLELNLPGLKQRGHAVSLLGKQSAAQKIIAMAAEREKVEVGELVVVQPDVTIAHQDAAAVVRAFKEIGTEYVWNPARISVALARCNDSDGCVSAADHRLVREFVRRQGIPKFYDVYEGGCHQLVVEDGLVAPGQLVLGSDVYATSYGALSAFAAAISPAEMATVWATGRIWLRVPPTIRIDVTGRRARGVYTRDVILYLLKRLGPQRADYAAIEYQGPAVSHMSISERVTLCNASADLGAKAAICPFEAVTRRYLNARGGGRYQAMLSDKDAEYVEMFQINIDQLTPQIAGPNSAAEIHAARELDGLSVQMVVIGGGTNGRFDDLRVAADILKGKQVHQDCRVLVVPASRSVYL